MKRKIIIVDDNPDFIYMVKRGLERLSEDYKVIGAKDGEECFRLLNETEKPSLILLDIMMPGIDGWDVFAKIKESTKWKDIPIVFLTAKNDAYSKAFGKITAQAYVQKPFELYDLKQKIDEILTYDINNLKEKIDVIMNQRGEEI